ncbi:MAG: helix-turn-helix domain-containing protein [Candidatus Hodarchaeales archaeon]
MTKKQQSIYLKLNRKKTGLTQKKISELLNIKEQSYQKYEYGEYEMKWSMMDKFRNIIKEFCKDK